MELPLTVESFLTHLVVERGRSPRTIAAYRGDLERWVGFLESRGSSVEEASNTDLGEYVDHLGRSGLAPASVIRMASSVRGMYGFLTGEGLLSEDPSTGLELRRRPDPLPRALSLDEVDHLLGVVSAAAELGEPVHLRDAALLELLYATGARVSEACALGFGDLDLDSRLVRLTGKRSKERIVPLGQPARVAVEVWLENGRPELLVGGSGTRGGGSAARDAADAVFLGARGRRLSRQAAWEVMKRWSALAGLRADVSPHVLRHSCATHLLDNGADIRTVAELLGHASVSTTQIYTRVATSRLFESYREAHPRAGNASSAGGRR